ncbi:MAG: hypothetical protein ABI051_07120 [Vicinamibacterales bacterium]
MLRGNLSTRPFYNERLVNAAIGAVALVALLLTALNATRIVSLSRERAAVRARLASSRSETARLSGHVRTLQQGTDRAVLARLASAAHEANELIERRTFSWTTLFTRLEKTMPLDVRLLSVSPRVDKDTLSVSMTVVARSLDDVFTFIDALAATGAFYDIGPSEQTTNDDGTYTALVEASYLAARPAPPADSGAGSLSEARP